MYNSHQYRVVSSANIVTLHIEDEHIKLLT